MAGWLWHCAGVDRKVVKRVQAQLKARDLASDRRAGTYAKDKASKLKIGFARRKWPVLLAVVVLAPAMAAGVALLLPLRVRGLVVGSGLASGGWAAWVVVITFSGSTAMTAGGAAEEWTASELRRRRRWRLINGVSLKYEIDHIAVGSGGVVVVETKWSAQPWNDGDPDMRRRLEKARSRLEENLRHVTLAYRPQLAGAPVYGLLVLWSAQPGGEPDHEAGPGGVSIIAARRLRSWLDDKAEGVVVPAVQRDILDALTRKADELDRYRIRVSGPPRPSLERALIRWLVEPSAAIIASLYAAALAGKAGTIALTAELLATTTAGLIARRGERLRWAGNAAIATNGALAVAVLAYVVIVGTAK